MFSQPFTSPVDLPFNWNSLAGGFELRGPLQDPGGAGVLIVLVGSSLLLAADNQLPQQLPS